MDVRWPVPETVQVIGTVAAIAVVATVRLDSPLVLNSALGSEQLVLVM